MAVGYEEGREENPKQRFETHIDSGTCVRSNYWAAGLYNVDKSSPGCKENEKKSGGEGPPDQTILKLALHLHLECTVSGAASPVRVDLPAVS